MSGGRVPFEILPGRLVRVGEPVEILCSGTGRLVISRGVGGGEGVVFEGALGGSMAWNPPGPGMYVLEAVVGSVVYRRPLAVVAEGWAVCQMTVGAFTAEDFAETIHGAGLAADYYARMPRSPEDVAFTTRDPRWVEYERMYGDAIHAHVMAGDLGFIGPSLAHDNANWDTLDVDGIVERLAGLRRWWDAQGYEPMNRIATYTPCNAFVQACRKVGIRILHSIIPEQNWSDDVWVINHWGMPNCPFWVATDDFRKAGKRGETGLLAMTMNHYGVLCPHITRWGDYVLSPSHYLRWIRTTECGPEPLRFGQFLRDTVGGWHSLSGHPFFFSAGFEFGRTFGTSKMTDFNRLGIESLVALADGNPLVFATSRDVLAYYDRHLSGHPESVFLQRDYWAGADVNSKPLMAGGSAIIERRAYKALVREGEWLPMFHYDYTRPWHFPADSQDAPDDHASEDRRDLGLEAGAGQIVLRAAAPLPRTVPVVVWDAKPAGALPADFSAVALPVLDDKRHHWLIEVPAGWQGEATVKLEEAVWEGSPHPSWWKTQTFGEGDRLHTYLSFDLPLVETALIPIRLRRPAFVEAVQAPVGDIPAGPLTLEVGPLRTWHRFRGIASDDLLVTDGTLEAVEALAARGKLLPEDWRDKVAAHIEELEAAMLRVTGAKKILLGVHCGANQPIRAQSRAAAFDVVRHSTPPLSASESGDGVIAFGPGRSFWYHPRSLPIRLHGLEALRGHPRVRLVLNSFHAAGPPCRYQVACPGLPPVLWTPSASPLDSEAFLVFDFPTEAAICSPGPLTVRADQKGVLHDWWADGGSIAAIHALWFIAD
jgi:hypothetical protein